MHLKRKHQYNMEEEIKKDIDDIEEDKRESNESLKDEFDDSGSEIKNEDDMAEDEREEGETLEDLKKALSDALYQSAMKDKKIEELEKELNDAHAVFMGTGRESIEEKKDYDSKIKEYK